MKQEHVEGVGLKAAALLGADELLDLDFHGNIHFPGNVSLLFHFPGSPSPFTAAAPDVHPEVLREGEPLAADAADAHARGVFRLDVGPQREAVLPEVVPAAVRAPNSRILLPLLPFLVLFPGVARLPVGLAPVGGAFESKLCWDTKNLTMQCISVDSTPSCRQRFLT